MKKAILILLLLTLPWQAMAAVQRSLGHVLGTGGKAPTLVIKHLAEHTSYLPHHHEDEDADGDVHEDTSDESFQHLADFDQSSGTQMLGPFKSDVAIGQLPTFAPVFRLETFSDRTTPPLLRPPSARA